MVVGDPVRLAISVRPSPDTNDHEVVLVGDDQNLVERFGAGAIGLDPDDMLIAPSPLLPATPRQCLVGRCDCGVIGCGDVFVTIAVGPEFVVWSAIDEPRAPIHFVTSQYRSEVERAVGDHSWETQERTAARLIRDGIDHLRLSANGLRFSWASGRVREGAMMVSLILDAGPYQVLVRIPGGGVEQPDRVAATAIALLARAPQSWPEVDWLPQGGPLDAPSIAGPGWRRWRM